MHSRLSPPAAALAGAVRPLLLQGPMSRFFEQLAGSLAAQSAEAGFQVFKINFNAGDRLLYRRQPAVDYTGTLAEWDWTLRRFIRKNQIDALVLFGDCRAYHRSAVKIAMSEGIPVFVFEEGYVRPDYITLEQGGVNGHSLLRRDWGRHHGDDVPALAPPRHMGQTYWGMARWAALYYLWSGLHCNQFPHYQHHRPFSVWGELAIGLRGVLRKAGHVLREHWLLHRLAPGGDLADRYFLVPLQVSTDAQITYHSAFKDIPEFIGKVIRSFHGHADSADHLVLKHHPLDRGRNGYATLISRLAAEYGIDGRVHYIHDGHLPTLLKHARGMVTINSTAGLSALYHGCPVKTLGEAVYDVPDVTFQGTLAAFWQKPGRVDMAVVTRFRDFLIYRTQVNGSFYAGRPQFSWNAATAAQGLRDDSSPRPGVPG